MTTKSLLAVQASEVPVPGQVFAGKFLIVDKLGEGGMGVVFSAHNGTTEAGFPCAIKWLKPEAVKDRGSVKRFLREADVAGYIKSEFVVKVFDKHETPTFLVMERLVGQNLREYMDALGRPLKLEELVLIIGPVLRAVRAAHRTELPTGVGVLHRDLKPENVFLDRPVDGEGFTPKVLDFGIAKLLEPTTNVTMETTDLVRGTPSYMAREQLFEPKSVGPWTDVHALGVMLYEMLAGKLPFQGETTFDVCLNVREGVYGPLSDCAPDLPEGLSAVIDRALHSDYRERYQSVADLEVALHPFLGSVPGSSVDLPPNPGLAGGSKSGQAAQGETSGEPSVSGASDNAWEVVAASQAPASTDTLDGLWRKPSRRKWIAAVGIVAFGGAIAWLATSTGEDDPESAAAETEQDVVVTGQEALPAPGEPAELVDQVLDLPGPGEIAPPDLSPIAGEAAEPVALDAKKPETEPVGQVKLAPVEPLKPGPERPRSKAEASKSSDRSARRASRRRRERHEEGSKKTQQSTRRVAPRSGSMGLDEF